MRLLPMIATASLIACSAASSANDVTGFSVRGVTPGMDSMQACDTLSAHFAGEHAMKEKLGIPRNSSDWWLNVDRAISKGGEYNAKGCSGGYKLYDRKIDALVRQDHIEVKSQSNRVYMVKNSQQLNAGNSIEDCTNRRTAMIETLVSKYGDPTIRRNDQKRGATYEHLIWDFSKQPNLRSGDDGLEEYTAYIQCEMYKHGTSFALMKTETKVHSGKALAESRSVVSAQKSFDTEL